MVTIKSPLSRRFALCQLCRHHICQFDKLPDGELFGSFRHYVLLKEALRNGSAGEYLAQTHAQHLAPLVEHRLYDALEENLVAAEIGNAVARHSYHGALHFGRRIEDIFVYREEIFHVVPRLNEHTQDAVGLGAGRGSHALGHLALYHARATRYQVLVVEHLEEYLRGYVVGIVSRQYELLSVENGAQIHAQKVLADDVVDEGRPSFVEVFHRFRVYFHDLYRSGFLDEILRQHTHSRAYFQYRYLRTCVYGVCYALGYAQIGQKMLAEILLWSYLFHNFVCKGSESREQNEIKTELFISFAEAHPILDEVKGSYLLRFLLR